MDECIAAISTANGTGGVAIIRLSGGNALEIAETMFKLSAHIKEFVPNYMYPGEIAGDGFSDYGFMVFFKAPKSFTGENVVEFHCHGGVQIARGILKKALLSGARSAERGEFTKRAFLNGKLSLASAEGMADMINAESLALLRAGKMMYCERLTKEVNVLQQNLTDVLARIAVEIDYPEEDSDGLDWQKIAEDITVLSNAIKRLNATYSGGKKIKSGVTAAICGKPNTGKSSLLNALLGYDKAIVSSTAGTTRDAVEGDIEINGVKFNLIDTAGIRERAGEIESIGIERAKAAISYSDILLYVSDSGEFGNLAAGASGKIIKVFGKCDAVKPHGDFDIAISAKTGEGLNNLKQLMYKAVAGDFSADSAYIVEERHYNALKRAEAALSSAAEAIGECTADLISVDLKEAWEALGEITGETANEEIISAVFQKFCVGK